MKIKSFKVLITFMLITATHQAIAIPASERAALIAFYHSAHGDNGHTTGGWLGEEGTECNWKGVSCNDEHVTALFLSNMRLEGAIPPELGQLNKLSFLALQNNQLTGSIPSTLGQLQKLETLYLDRNQLTGSIPSELGKLSQLTELSLELNQLTGSIPPELGQLSLLTNLGLGNNQLTGSIPPELGQLSKLTSLYPAPAYYSQDTLLLDIPTVLLYNFNSDEGTANRARYRVQLKNDGHGVLSVINTAPLP